MNAPAQPNATAMAPGVPRAISLGEWCVQHGLVTPTQVEEGLAIQREQQDRLLPPLRLGQILLERGHLTTKDLMRALSSQRRELRHCPDCRLQTTVLIESPAARHRCATCNLTLIPSPDAPSDAGADSPAGSDDELPEEVRTAALLPANHFGSTSSLGNSAAAASAASPSPGTPSSRRTTRTPTAKSSCAPASTCRPPLRWTSWAAMSAP